MKKFLLLFVVLCSCASPKFGASLGSDSFAGHDRKDAKLMPVLTPPTVFKELKMLLAKMPTDAIFKGLNLSRDAPRQPIEQVSYGVKNAFLWGIKKESDNDFHLIVGDSLGQNFLTCEVTGLPDAQNANFKLFKGVRDSVLAIVGTVSGNSYIKFKPALKISIIGSLFFDTDHAAGVVGFDQCHPKTACELHPVIYLKRR